MKLEYGLEAVYDAATSEMCGRCAARRQEGTLFKECPAVIGGKDCEMEPECKELWNFLKGTEFYIAALMGDLGDERIAV